MPRYRLNYSIGHDGAKAAAVIGLTSGIGISLLRMRLLSPKWLIATTAVSFLLFGKVYVSHS